MGTETMLALQSTSSQAIFMVSRQVELLLSPLETHSQMWQSLVFKRVNSCFLFCHHPLRDRNATWAFPHRRIWQPVGTWLWLPRQGPGQPHQNFSISSGTWVLHWSLYLQWSAQLPNPRQSLVTFLILFFFFGLLSSLILSESESALHLPSFDLSVLGAVFCDCRNSAVRSGQSGYLPAPMCCPHLRLSAT